MAFTNTNQCRSFNLTVGTGVTKLSAIECTEVTIYNSSPVPVLVFDNGYAGSDNSYVLAPSSSFIFRGITSGSDLSANGVGASAVLYCRAQYYAMHILGRT
jgi:hypothetical protein|tara:strand:- start:4808 stop:5110 length:303 start_codon:yes stop_codon:yes gene_type:complete